MCGELGNLTKSSQEMFVIFLCNLESDGEVDMEGAWFLLEISVPRLDTSLPECSVTGTTVANPRSRWAIVIGA